MLKADLVQERAAVGVDEATSPTGSSGTKQEAPALQKRGPLILTQGFVNREVARLERSDLEPEWLRNHDVHDRTIIRHMKSSHNHLPNLLTWRHQLPKAESTHGRCVTCMT